ncbi:hypothetical protein BpHYR1_013154, partial [Brachionus plicatilis]
TLPGKNLISKTFLFKRENSNSTQKFGSLPNLLLNVNNPIIYRNTFLKLDGNSTKRRTNYRNNDRINNYFFIAVPIVHNKTFHYVGKKNLNENSIKVGILKKDRPFLGTWFSKSRNLVLVTNKKKNKRLVIRLKWIRSTRCNGEV